MSRGFTAIVFDNSDSDFANKEYCDEKMYNYYTLNKNIGLSRAYNYVLKNTKFNDDDYIIILDDDTKITTDYIKEALKNIEKKEYDVILPIVKSNNLIISPSNVQFNCRVKAVNNISALDFSKITAINSGMVVKSSVYKKIKYNEKMFLDYVDHSFMKNVRKLNLRIKVLDSEIVQSFSRNEKKSLLSELFRFKIYIKDFKIYCKSCSNLCYYYINVFIYSVKLSLKHKNLVFLFELFRR